jgi:hypothetical protein
MKNKIEALLSRSEIRDCFDIEFMLRRGTDLPVLSVKQLGELRKRAAGFKDADFKVKLGSILDINARAYYVQNRLSYLIEKLSAISSSFERRVAAKVLRLSLSLRLHQADSLSVDEAEPTVEGKPFRPVLVLISPFDRAPGCDYFFMWR